MRILRVVLKLTSAASPRSWGTAEFLAGAAMVIYWSRRFWIWNVSGVEAVGNVRKDSRGETASV
jgi:hypothetical protein